MYSLDLFKDIKAFIFDVDGVLTDGQLLLTEEGEQLRSMNIRDGFAIQRAIQEGYKIFVISGGISEGVRHRLQLLGVNEIFLGIRDKNEIYQSLLTKYSLSASDILYMGDDIPDLEVMKKIALPCCPADAIPEIKQISLYVSPLTGGKGCVRDVIEKVLRLHNSWWPPLRIH